MPVVIDEVVSEIEPQTRPGREEAAPVAEPQTDDEQDKLKRMLDRHQWRQQRLVAD